MEAGAVAFEPVSPRAAVIRRFFRWLRRLFRRRPSITVCFLPRDVWKAPTIVGPVKSIRRARRHLKRLGKQLPPHAVYVDGPEYRKACKQRLDKRKQGTA